MMKRRRTSSDIETDDSDDDSGQFTTTPAQRKRKKLDPVSFQKYLYELGLFVNNDTIFFRWNNVKVYMNQ